MRARLASVSKALTARHCFNVFTNSVPECLVEAQCISADLQEDNLIFPAWQWWACSAHSPAFRKLSNLRYFSDSANAVLPERLLQASENKAEVGDEGSEDWDPSVLLEAACSVDHAIEPYDQREAGLRTHSVVAPEVSG
jgi:hypothetical protein